MATTGAVSAIATTSSGDTVIGGLFTQLGSVVASSIARWSAGAWSPLGAGINGEVRALVQLPNGDLIAGGGFTMAGGVPAANVALWNGATWAPLGSGLPGIVNALAVLGNGDLIAGGTFPTHLARWNGVAWQGILPAGTAPNGVTSVAVLPSGDLVVAGSLLFPAVPASVARWDGSTWFPYPGSQSFTLLAVSPNGDLVAGTAGTASWIGRWTGSSWTSLGSPSGNGYLRALLALPTGDIVAGFTAFSIPIVVPTWIRRWDGSAWSQLADADGSVYALALGANDDLLVGGNFRRVDSAVSALFARRTTTCPALASPFGSGCVGPAGLGVLAAERLPWIGSTFRSRASGVPNTGLAVGVLGLATAALPLASILPSGAGCSLWVAPDLLSLHLPFAGAVEVDVPLPNSSALVGGVLHQQVVPFDLTTSGAIVAVSATNALSLTIGSY